MNFGADRKTGGTSTAKAVGVPLILKWRGRDVAEESNRCDQ